MSELQRVARSNVVFAHTLINFPTTSLPRHSTSSGYRKRCQDKKREYYVKAHFGFARCPKGLARYSSRGSRRGLRQDDLRGRPYLGSRTLHMWIGRRKEEEKREKERKRERGGEEKKRKEAYIETHFGFTRRHEGTASYSSQGPRRGLRQDAP